MSDAELILASAAATEKIAACLDTLAVSQAGRLTEQRAVCDELVKHTTRLHAGAVQLSRRAAGCPPPKGGD